MGPRPLALALLAAATAPAARASDGSHSVKDAGDSVVAEYRFDNFNKDRLAVLFPVKKAAAQAAEAAWGYSPQELDGLKAALNKARQAALENAMKKGHSQEQLDAALAALQRKHDQDRAAYFGERAFRLAPDKTVSVDIPALVRRSAPQVKPLALALDAEAGKRRYGSDDVVGAATALVQTALEYKVPPAEEGGRRTGGMLPPLAALLKGWGDCDTKSGALASILTNYSSIRLIGVSVPHHYLLGILSTPGKGDLFIEHQGLKYVLIEPAGPAWLPPGMVSDSTAALLQGADGYRVESLH